MAVSSVGLRPKSDCSGKAQKQLYSKLETSPLVREGVPYQETRNCNHCKSVLGYYRATDRYYRTTDRYYCTTDRYCRTQRSTAREGNSKTGTPHETQRNSESNSTTVDQTIMKE
jgi:hypothetical protein